MLKFLFTPLPKPQSSIKNLIRTFAFGGIASIFVMLFRPFDIENNHDIWYYNLLILSMGLVFSSAIYFMEFVVPRFFTSFFGKWNIGKAIIWYTWLIFFVSGVMFLYKSFLGGFAEFTLQEYFFVIGRMTSIGLIITFFTLGIYRYLSSNGIAQIASHEIYFLKGSNGEKVEIKLDELVFVKSDNNYVDIHLESNGKRSTVVVRSSLKNVEDQILNPFSPIVKCHRSYLVNLNKVQIKNAKGRNLSLEVVDSNEIIPVSSKFSEQVFKRL